jgi:hypothetical protein
MENNLLKSPVRPKRKSLLTKQNVYIRNYLKQFADSRCCGSLVPSLCMVSGYNRLRHRHNWSTPWNLRRPTCSRHLSVRKTTLAGKFSLIEQPPWQQSPECRLGLCPWQRHMSTLTCNKRRPQWIPQATNAWSDVTCRQIPQVNKK